MRRFIWKQLLNTAIMVSSCAVKYAFRLKHLYFYFTGAGVYNATAVKTLRTPVPDRISIGLNDSLSVTSLPNYVIVGEEIHLVAAVVLPGGTGDIAVAVGES